jgi:ankyrin repeat protein
MKTFNTFVVALVFVFSASAADVFTEKLQRGLFEEEANHNLDAAIKEYQSITAQSDEQRKVIATALFRLGECYRKLGRTNDANAQYQRIVRDFSEQEQLVRLANEILKSGSPAVATTPSGNRSEMIHEFQRRMAVLRVEGIAQEMEADRLEQVPSSLLLRSAAATNYPGATSLVQAYETAVQKLMQLRTQFGEEHPDVKASKALIATIEQQIGEVAKSIRTDARSRTKYIAAELDRVAEELKKAEAKSDAGISSNSAPALTQVESEELARVKTLAKNSPDLLQSPGKDGFSELQRAARDGHHSVVDFILAQNVNPNGIEYGSPPPLLLAAGRGHLRIVQLLLDKGADVNAVSLGTYFQGNFNGQTALMSACENGFRSVVELLLDRGADVNKLSAFDTTALHHAALKGRTAIAELLLKRGARPDVLSKDLTRFENWPNFSVNGATPLHFATERGITAMVELLLKSGASATLPNHAKKTPLHLAASLPDTNICVLLLDKGADPDVEDRDGNTSFGVAISSGRVETVRLLLAKGADINRRLAAKNDNSYPQYPLHLALLKNSRPVLEVLLAAKPKLEVLNGRGQTPLLLAIELQTVEMIELLLDAGADPNHEVNSIRPLMAALSKNNARLIEVLLDHGANPNVLSNDGNTPLSYAQQFLKEPGRVAPDLIVGWRRIEQALREHGANENLQRLSAIDFTQPSWTSPGIKVFYRGTNDYNRYTLFELLAAVFNGNNRPSFPDLARVTIERLEGTNAKPKEIAVDLEQIFRANDCAKDMWLEWGDRVSFPELDHPLNESWAGLSTNVVDLLTRCLTRRVRIVVKQETNTVKLVENVSNGASPRFQPGLGMPVPSSFQVTFGNPVGSAFGNPVVSSSTEKPEKVLNSFRLKDVVYGANVLRASSDPTRVRVSRIDSATGKTHVWTIDLTKIAMSNEVSAGPPGYSAKLWNQHDLWLRDGDVIEIPERQ